MLICWYLAGDVNNKCETHDPAYHFVVDIEQEQIPRGLILVIVGHL